MKLPGNYRHTAAWLDGEAPFSDIVLSSRVRLARNVAGFLFFAHADAQQRQELHSFVRDRIMACPLGKDLCYLDMEQTPSLERQILTERHLISKQLASGEGSRGVAITADESLSLMVNEEDHLRIQVLAGGLQLREIYQRINQVDDMLDEQMEFAFSSEYGYLTACPTNIGTGIRVSVMLHLPALKMAGQIDKVFRAAKDMHLAVRGIYGEGSEPVGDLYQLSNQTTLGKSEQQIIDELITRAVEPILEYERRARQSLVDNRSAVLDDKIFRARGVLANARLVSSQETLYMLSYVRLGIDLGRFDDISLHTVNEVFLLTQPAHLQNFYQKSLDTVARDKMRAEFVRRYFN